METTLFEGWVCISLPRTGPKFDCFVSLQKFDCHKSLVKCGARTPLAVLLEAINAATTSSKNFCPTLICFLDIFFSRHFFFSILFFFSMLFFRPLRLHFSRGFFQSNFFKFNIIPSLTNAHLSLRAREVF